MRTSTSVTGSRRAGLRIVFNPNAVSRQYYAVDPADFTRRTREAARSNEELAAKHPELVDELTAGLEFTTRRSRLLFGTLAKLPAPLSRPLRALAAHLVRSGRLDFNTYRLFFGVQTMEYHRGVRQARRRLRKGRGIVLAYHSISDLGGDTLLAAYGVPPARFAAQLDSLARGGARFIGQEELLEALDDDRPLPARTVLITFDDCYADLLTEAAPLLAERGIPAVAFAVTGMIGGTNEWDHEGGGGHLALLDAAGLRALAGGNVAIGSHGATHRRLTDLGADEMRLELQRSAAKLSALGLPRPRTFSYPYGVCTPETAAAVRDAGYAGAFTVEPGSVRRGDSRHALPRIEVLASDTPVVLRVKIATAAWPARLAGTAAAGVGDEGVSPRSNPRLYRAAQRIGWRLLPLVRARARRRLADLPPGAATVVTVNWNSWAAPCGADRRREPAQSRRAPRSSPSTTARTTSPGRRLREHPEISTLPPAAQPRPRARPRPRRARCRHRVRGAARRRRLSPPRSLARGAAGTARRGRPGLRRPPQPRLRASLLLGDAHGALRRAGPLLPLRLPARGKAAATPPATSARDLRRARPPTCTSSRSPASAARATSAPSSATSSTTTSTRPASARPPSRPSTASSARTTPARPGTRRWSGTSDEIEPRARRAGASASIAFGRPQVSPRRSSRTAAARNGKAPADAGRRGVLDPVADLLRGGARGCGRSA